VSGNVRVVRGKHYARPLERDASPRKTLDPAVFPAYVRRGPYHDPLHQRSAPRRLCYRRADCPTYGDFAGHERRRRKARRSLRAIALQSPYAYAYAGSCVLLRYNESRKAQKLTLLLGQPRAPLASCSAVSAICICICRKLPDPATPDLRAARVIALGGYLIRDNRALPYRARASCMASGHASSMCVLLRYNESRKALWMAGL
jgi:hypothetical protein